jgi:hypothetical protein
MLVPFPGVDLGEAGTSFRSCGPAGGTEPVFPIRLADGQFIKPRTASATLS